MLQCRAVPGEALDAMNPVVIFPFLWYSVGMLSNNQRANFLRYMNYHISSLAAIGRTGPFKDNNETIQSWVDGYTNRDLYPVTSPLDAGEQHEAP